MNSLVRTRRISFISLAIFALNAVICAPLFRIEYLDDFQSNEGSWITFARFLSQNWPHVSWFPWFNAGMPFEDTYLPLVSGIVAIISTIVRCSPAHAFHFLAALAYSLAPVFLFLFALGVSGRLAPSVWAGVLWSLLSPSIVFPQLLRDLGTPWGLRRLHNIVIYGETPHNVAICLLPISLLFTWRYLETPNIRKFALAALAAAAVMLTNAFGVVVVFASSLILCAARKHLAWKPFAAVCGIQFAAYLAICRFLPPSLIRLLETNSQLVSGDYRFSSRTLLLGAGFAAILATLWASTRRISDPLFQFAILFSACFGGITALGFAGINLMPQPTRYHLELEPGLCLIAAFVLVRIPSKAVIAICVPFLAWIAVKDYRFARNLIHPVDIAQSAPYREARWISSHLPGQRVLVAGEAEWLFNLFSDNPQMGAGHEPTAPNWVQRVAVYTIFTGQNAGEQDAAISILWLKAFGVGAIVVPGKDSKDHYHAVANPDKFDGLLPLVWREGGDSIYQVPLQSTSLAHVIPKSAVVTRQPANGLDVDRLRTYVNALEPASITWENPDHAKIAAKMDSSEVLSIQITYDPGWEARVGGRKVKTSADQLGFIVVDPACLGDCSVELEFTGGVERRVALGVSLLVVLSLLVMLSWRALF
jgi:hypothetical protein